MIIFLYVWIIYLVQGNKYTLVNENLLSSLLDS